ncbi:MAG: hypothetical protein RL342_2256, partial [Pseudomonadota bacterium]
LAGDQAQPIEQRAVEQVGVGGQRPPSQQVRRRRFQTQHQRPTQPQVGAPVGRQAGQQEHQGQGVQNAEINEALRKHGPRGQCDKQRAAQHLQPAPPKTRPALPLRLRQRLPQAGAQHKQAHDQAALPGPEGITVKILLDMAKLIEVKAKVESRHPDHGETPQGVNSMDPASWLGQCLWVHTNTIPDRHAAGQG